MCVFVSPELNPSSTNPWVDSFATYAYSCHICLLDCFIVMIIHDISKQIKQSAHIGKIFACWHLEIAIKSTLKDTYFILTSCERKGMI